MRFSQGIQYFLKLRNHVRERFHLFRFSLAKVSVLPKGFQIIGFTHKMKIEMKDFFQQI